MGWECGLQLFYFKGAAIGGLANEALSRYDHVFVETVDLFMIEFGVESLTLCVCEYCGHWATPFSYAC